jgi:8-oxo-dGTP pyrophosphatase MutT (NUDIX family)
LAERLRRCLDPAPAATAGARAQAAVALALTDEQTPRLLLIRRSLQLALHPGEIAFPGGKLEPGDADLRAAAMREAWEEVALPAASFEVCGSLTPRISMSGLAVSAFVGVVPAGLALLAEAGEVEEILYVPLEFFAQSCNLRVDRVWRRGTLRRTPRFHYENYTIWGMTGAFIVELVNRLYGAGLVVETPRPPVSARYLQGEDTA